MVLFFKELNDLINSSFGWGGGIAEYLAHWLPVPAAPGLNRGSGVFDSARTVQKKLNS